LTKSHFLFVISYVSQVVHQVIFPFLIKKIDLGKNCTLSDFFKVKHFKKCSLEIVLGEKPHSQSKAIPRKEFNELARGQGDKV